MKIVIINIYGTLILCARNCSRHMFLRTQSLRHLPKATLLLIGEARFQTHVLNILPLVVYGGGGESGT